MCQFQETARPEGLDRQPEDILEMTPSCRPCLQGLIEQAAAMSAPDDDGLRRRAEDAARQTLAEMDDPSLTSPEMANYLLKAIVGVTGVTDPYAGFKQREMARAREAAESTVKRLDGAFPTLLKTAAMGNSLDFFTPADLLMDEVEGLLKAGLEFHHNDSRRLALALFDKPGLVLFLADNAGEIFFDLPLIRYIQERARRLVVVVKGGPALNDLTRPDLEAAGLLEELPEVADTGTIGAGIVWKHLSDDFRALLDQADLVVSKGMANFETIWPHPLKADTFFIFKVKCRPMQDFLQAPLGSFWALWRDGSGLNPETGTA